MSRENRLARLGLLHLIDKPKELQEELNRREAERQATKVKVVDPTDEPPHPAGNLRPADRNYPGYPKVK